MGAGKYLLCCLGAVASVAHGQIKLAGPSTLAQIGAGYDVLTGEMAGDCVNTGKLAPVQGEDGYFQIVKITDEKDFSTQLNVSVKAKYGLFNASGSFVRETTFNSYSVYLAVISRVDIRTNRAETPALKKATFDLGQKDPKAFRQQCGTHFVRTQTRGGEYSAIVEIFTSTSTEKQTVEGEAGGATGIFKAEAKGGTKLSQVLTKYSYSARLVRKGGQGAVAADSDAILADALAFPVALRSMQDADLFVSAVELQPYLNLTLPDALRTAANSDTPALLRLEAYDDAARERRALLGDLEYIRLHPGEFQPHDAAALAGKEQTLKAVLATMKGGVLQCLDPLLNKCSDADLKVPDRGDLAVSLPARVPGETRAQLQARIDRATVAVNGLYNLTAIQDFAGCNFPGLGNGCGYVQQALIQYCNRERCRP